MDSELYRYLILYKQLRLPGIGTLQLDRKPAESDFANRMIQPPTYSVTLHQGDAPTSKNMFRWLANVLGISERDAVIKFNDFAFELKNKLVAGEKFEWNGIGTLSRGLGGEIRFESALKDMVTDTPVPAVKVLREKAEHTVRVGEDERSSTEMMEMLHPGEVKRSYFWAAGLVLVVLSFIFAAYYFSVHGVNTTSAGNQRQLHLDSQAASTPARTP